MSFFSLAIVVSLPLSFFLKEGVESIYIYLSLPSNAGGAQGDSSGVACYCSPCQLHGG